MILWRISRHRDLGGKGGRNAPGRWHFAGQPVIYMAEHPAAALLEVCVHIAANDVPPTFTLLRIEGPAPRISTLQATDLPKGWRTQLEVTRALGTAWLRKKGGVLLRVPSAILPHTSNYLFSPLHPGAAQFMIAESFEYPFDVRLKK